MVVDFWELQRRARKRTTLYLFFFFALTLGLAIASEYALRLLDPDDYNPSFPVVGLIFLGATFGSAAYHYLMYKTLGGSYVAKSVGGRQVSPNTRDPVEKQLMNVVQEIALATTLPVPDVYIIPVGEINAFAAGLTPDKSVMAVTEGALERLNREELQGVIAHEFGHIANGDMMINLRLAALLMGFFFVLYIGLRLVQAGTFRGRDENRQGGNVIVLIAGVLMIAGAITWLFGSILKAMVSRQREYLADASSIQYTRYPEGLANALRKIANETNHDMPYTGAPYAHMYFDDHSSLFATHPPIWKRIAAIEGKEIDS